LKDDCRDILSDFQSIVTVVFINFTFQRLVAIFPWNCFSGRIIRNYLAVNAGLHLHFIVLLHVYENAMEMGKQHGNPMGIKAQIWEWKWKEMGM